MTNGKAGSAAPDPTLPLLALRAQLNSSMHNLWAVYAAVGGAGAAFGSGAGVTQVAATVVTVMFCLFTGGHLALLRQTLRASEGVRLDLDVEWRKRKGPSQEERPPGLLVWDTLEQGAANRNPLLNNTVIHLLLDLLIVGAIWGKFLTQLLWGR